MQVWSQLGLGFEGYYQLCTLTVFDEAGCLSSKVEFSL